MIVRSWGSHSAGAEKPVAEAVPPAPGVPGAALPAALLEASSGPPQAASAIAAAAPTAAPSTRRREKRSEEAGSAGTGRCSTPGPGIVSPMPGAYETVIGLECHVELSTATKMFCGCRERVRRRAEHQRVPGLPGPSRASLPGAEREGDRVRSSGSGWRSAAAIAPHSLFHRKNYFYPDMPKNFQISQYDLPVCVGGHLDDRGGRRARGRSGSPACTWRRTRARRRTWARRAGSREADYALVDYNRAGVPLVEVVSEPDMRSRRGGARLPHRAARDARGARRLGRADGGGVAPLRRERHVRPVGSARSSARRSRSRT